MVGTSEYPRFSSYRNGHQFLFVKGKSHYSYRANKRFIGVLKIPVMKYGQNEVRSFKNKLETIQKTFYVTNSHNFTHINTMKEKMVLFTRRLIQQKIFNTVILCHAF